VGPTKRIVMFCAPAYGFVPIRKSLSPSYQDLGGFAKRGNDDQLLDHKEPQNYGTPVSKYDTSTCSDVSSLAVGCSCGSSDAPWCVHQPADPRNWCQECFVPSICIINFHSFVICSCKFPLNLYVGSQEEKFLRTRHGG
jgi:hypothetical protein